jgi:hypothetical protein
MSKSTISTFQLFERFPDKEAARVYLAKWLAAQAWATKVRIMRDGPGGMEVA